jgi:hypothetical protein
LFNPWSDPRATPFYDVFRSLSPSFDFSLHRICPRKIASILKEKSGAWRVQVRRKGRCISETFVAHENAKRWALDTVFRCGVVVLIGLAPSTQDEVLRNVLPHVQGAMTEREEQIIQLAARRRG